MADAIGYYMFWHQTDSTKDFDSRKSECDVSVEYFYDSVKRSQKEIEGKKVSGGTIQEVSLKH